MPGTKKKTSMPDNIGSNKGCFTIIAIIVGVGVLFYILTRFSTGFSFDSLPRFVGKTDSGFHIEWPFGKSSGKSGGDAPAGGNEASDSGSEDMSAGGKDAPAGGNETSDSGSGDMSAGGKDMSAGVGEASDGAGTGQPAGGNERMQAEYLELYSKHIEFIGAVKSFSDGEITRDELKRVCEEVNEFFDGAVSRFNYLEDGPGRENQSILMAAAMSDQIASNSIIKHIDGDITAEIADPASDFNRNAVDAGEALKAIDTRLSISQ